MFFAWLKRYMPRSLYGRAALILLLPVVTLQLAISVVFVQRHYDGVTRQMTRAALLDVSYLLSLPPGEAQQVADALEMQLEQVATAPSGDAFWAFDLTGRAIVGELRQGLDGVQSVDVAERRRVTLWVDRPDGVVRIEFDRRRVAAANPHQLLVLMTFVGVLMTLIAYLFLRNQLRPIKRLAAAATEFGKGRKVRYHPSGAMEVRAAGNAFLDMRGRIERQTQTRTQMLSGVSHDLRTPLTRLRLGLEMMDEAEAAPLRRDVDEMAQMLDGFLSFARGDAEDSRALTEVRPLVEEIVSDARRAGRETTLASADGDGSVPLRPTAVRRAVSNLISNATRHGTRAEVSYVLGDRALVISVEDDGPGIAPEDRGEALRPFTRLDAARNQDRGGGVGLGLSIAADIARSHGGVLRLGESKRLGGLRADLVLAR